MKATKWNLFWLKISEADMVICWEGSKLVSREYWWMVSRYTAKS